MRGDGSYLVTGGLGALGFAAARWLAAAGAGHVVLVGRSEPSEPRRRDIEELAEQTDVAVATCDVSDREALAAVLAGLPHPLRGVIHAAGALDDALLADQSVARFDTVFAGKVEGARNLDALTRDAPLDFFVLYGSAAGLLASPGQANYVAANAWLDALAQHRRAQGLPARCVAWGAFGDAGLAARNADRLAGRGLGLLTTHHAEAWLGRVIASGDTLVAPCPLDARQWIERYPQLAGRPYVARLAAEGRPTEPGGAWRDELSGIAAPDAEKRVLRRLLGELGQVLRADPARLDAGAPFRDLGVDSLLGMELRNRLEHASGVALPVTAVWTWPTPEALARHLAGAMTADAPTSTTVATDTALAMEPIAEESAPAYEALDDDALIAAALTRLG